MLPATAHRLVNLGASVVIEPGLGASLNIADAEYAALGAVPAAAPHISLAAAGLVLRLRKPSVDAVHALARGCIHISYLDPFREKDLVRAFSAAGVSAISLELIPRTSLAQKMDVLSSQASLAGYASVILAAERLRKIFPMMTTPSGTVAPARVFVIGVGVAGLQAIATAKRLGAVVEAFDTRPVVEEQVKSVGGRFVKVDLGETGQTRDGYAKALSEEQLRKQRDAMARHCAAADVVITTAQVFGRRAPLIVTGEMLRGMKPGSVVVDMAVETGGNVEGSIPDGEFDSGGVKVIGVSNLPARVSQDASLMFSNNVGNFIEHFWSKDDKTLKLRLDDEILRGCLVTHGGEVVHDVIRRQIAEGGAP